jgi:hypothetical protein
MVKSKQNKGNMPYIKQDDRKLYDDLINQITYKLLNKLPANNGKHFSEGDLNYVISSVVWKLFDVLSSYGRGNTLVGVIECVKQEFIRRKLNNYEDKKIIENGDIN